jgi:hypothetical protein
LDKDGLSTTKRIAIGTDVMTLPALRSSISAAFRLPMGLPLVIHIADGEERARLPIPVFDSACPGHLAVYCKRESHQKICFSSWLERTDSRDVDLYFHWGHYFPAFLRIPLHICRHKTKWHEISGVWLSQSLTPMIPQEKLPLPILSPALPNSIPAGPHLAGVRHGPRDLAAR